MPEYNIIRHTKKPRPFSLLICVLALDILPLLEELLDSLLGLLTLGGLLEGIDGDNGLQGLQVQTVTK